MQRKWYNAKTKCWYMRYTRWNPAQARELTSDDIHISHIRNRCPKPVNAQGIFA